MNEPVFDHERLDVYRLSIEYVAWSYRMAKNLEGMNRPARDQWLRAAQSIPLNIAEGNGEQSLKDKNRFFEIARGSALECASIHELIQRTNLVSESSIEYEHEYRFTEYEYEYEEKTANSGRAQDLRC